jgi:hypothetical protein
MTAGSAALAAMARLARLPAALLWVRVPVAFHTPRHGYADQGKPNGNLGHITRCNVGVPRT